MRDIFSGIVLYIIVYAVYQYYVGNFPIDSTDIPYSVGRVVGDAIRSPYDLIVSFF